MTSEYLHKYFLCTKSFYITKVESSKLGNEHLNKIVIWLLSPMEVVAVCPYNTLFSCENSQFGIIAPSFHALLVSVPWTNFPVFDYNVIWTLWKITSELFYRTALNLSMSIWCFFMRYIHHDRNVPEMMLIFFLCPVRGCGAPFGTTDDEVNQDCLLSNICWKVLHCCKYFRYNISYTILRLSGRFQALSFEIGCRSFCSLFLKSL